MRRKYEDSIMFQTPSKNSNDYDFFNRLYENAYKTDNNDYDSEDFDIYKKIEELSVKPDDFDDVFTNMHKEAEAELGISKDKYYTNPIHNVMNNKLKEAKNNRQNLLSPNSSKEEEIKNPSSLTAERQAELKKQVEAINTLPKNKQQKALKQLLKDNPDLHNAYTNELNTQTETVIDKGMDKLKGKNYISDIIGAGISAVNDGSYSIHKNVQNFIEKNDDAGFFRNIAAEVAKGGVNIANTFDKLYTQALYKAAGRDMSENEKADMNRSYHEKTNEVNKKIKKHTDEMSTINEDSSFAEKVLKSTISSITQMAVGTALGNTLGTIGLSSSGAGISEAEERGVDNSVLYGNIQGIIEAGSEMIGGSKIMKSITNGAGFKTIKEAFESVGEEGIKGIAMEFLKEGGQEYLTEIANQIAGLGFKDANGNSMAPATIKEALEQQMIAFASGGLMGGIGATAANIAGKNNHTGQAIQDQNQTMAEKQFAEQQAQNPLQGFLKEDVNAPQTDINTVQKGKFMAPKEAQNINDALGFEAITEENINEILPSNPDAPYIEKTIDKNGQEVYITEDGNTVKASLAERVAKQTGTPVESLVQFTQEEAQARATQKEADNTVGAIEQSIQEQGAEATIKTLENSLKNGEITQEVFNTATEYVNAIANGTQQEMTQVNSTQHNLMQNNITTPDITQNKAIKNNISQQELTQVNTNQHELIQNDTKNTSSDVDSDITLNKEEKRAREEKVKKLNKVINSKVFKANYPNLKAEVVTKLNVEQQGVNELSKAIGREVVFYKADSKNAPNGFMKDNTLFLNGDYKGDVMVQVLGHETFHTLKTSNEEVFNKLVDYGVKNFSTREINKFLSGIDNEAEVNKLRNNPKLLSEEMLAEAFGNDFANKEFWASMKKNNKTLFDKVKEVIVKIFKDAEAKTTDFLTKKHIKELRGEFESIFGDLTKTESETIRFSTRSKEETAKITAPLLKVKEKTNDLQLRAGIRKLQGIKVDTKIKLIDVFEEAIATMSGNTDSAKENAKAFSKTLKARGIEAKQATAIAKYFANVVETSKINVMESTPKAKNVITSSSYKAKQPIKNHVKENFNKYYSRIVDSTNAGKLVNDVFYTKARISKNSFSISEHIMAEGLVDKNGKTVGKSLKELFADTIPAGKEIEFMEYALHKHNISRALQGKYIFFKGDGTPIHSNESAKIVKEMEAKNPDFANRQVELTGWINQFMKVWAVDTGLMSEDMHSMLKEMYNHYVPTNRSFQDHEELFGGGYGGKGFVDKSKPTKKAQQGGSARDIIDLQESIVNLVAKTVRTAKMNEVGQELVKAIKTNPAIKNIASIVAKPDNNVDNVVRILVKGEPVYVEIHNKQLLEMVEQVHSPEYDALTEVVKKFNGGVKALITSKNPLFAITNTLRDYQTYMINSTEANVFKRWGNIGKAIDLIAKDLKGQDIANTEYGLFKAMGIGGSGIMAKDNSKTLSNITGKKTVINKQTGAIEGYKEFGKIKKGWNKFNEGLEILTGSTETTFRLAEFLGAIERGESVEDATLKAMEITVDFARGGDITKSVDAYVKYLNAGVQGLDRFARQVKNHPVQTLTRSIAHIAAPALVLAAINGGDDEYEMLDDRTKDNNFLIPLKLFGGEEGQYLKLPKAREYGMVAMLAERLIYGRGFENLGTNIVDNMAPPSAISDNIIFDLARAGDNEAKDFAGRYIVPKALQDLPAREQYDDDTTVVAKWLGQLTGMSPKKIDYYLDGYTGIIGDTLQPLLTPSTYAVEGDEAGKIFAPFKKKFVADNAYSSGASSSYYDNLDTLQQMINVEQKDMSTEEKRAYTSETEAFKTYLNNTYGKDITDMGKAIKDKSLSENEKRLLRQYRNNAMKMANEEVKLFLSPKNR